MAPPFVDYGYCTAFYIQEQSIETVEAVAPVDKLESDLNGALQSVYRDDFPVETSRRLRKTLAARSGSGWASMLFNSDPQPDAARRRHKEGKSSRMNPLAC
jgi:hypothetical protein